MAATTVTEYLAGLPADRREVLNEVRRRINRTLPPGYKEGIQFGMISWFVPLSSYGELGTREGRACDCRRFVSVIPHSRHDRVLAAAAAELAGDGGFNLLDGDYPSRC